MRISLFDKIKGNSVNINGSVGNSNLNFRLLDFSGNIPSTIDNTINIYVSTNPNGVYEFRTIADALEYASLYKATYDKGNNKWVKIIIKSGYVIEHSTHIENMAFHRVIIESEDDVVMVKADKMTEQPSIDPTYRLKSVIMAYNNSIMPIINFSMKADKLVNNLVGVHVKNSSVGHIRPGSSFDGFGRGVRIGQASLGSVRGIILKNCWHGLSADDCSNVYAHNMSIENCGTGIRNEQISNIDAHNTNFIYGEKSNYILFSQFSSNTYIGGSVVTNWVKVDKPLIYVSDLSFVLAKSINASTSPGIEFSNIDVNQYTPNGFIIK